MGAGILIIGFLLIGMVAGWLAWIIYGKRYDMSGGELFFVGILGSFVGGGMGSLIMGAGFDLHLTGLLGSAIGAIVVLPIYAFIRRKVKKEDGE